MSLICRRLGFEDCVIIKSPATARGHYGMMIGLFRLHPHGPTHNRDIFFTDDSYQILTATPRLLIVRVRTEALRCVVIAAHAPHSGACIEEIESL